MDNLNCKMQAQTRECNETKELELEDKQLPTTH